MKVNTSERKRRRAEVLDQIVETIINEAPVPIGAYTISEHSARHSENIGQKLAPTQVYRSITRLVEAGRITHLVSCNAYAPARNDPAIHLLCAECNQHQPVADDQVAMMLRRMCARSGFTDREIHVELTGLCPDCCARQDA
ncbi:MAG: transcriptional repressor [Pseudomonadota bacterium]